jgi:transketolase
MVGAAGGFAKEGFIPFANTYASFCASRCADQVRVNMSYMKLPIKLIGLTAGFAAGILGATHMSIEDVSLMRSLPNIMVISPADCTEIIKCMLAVSETNEPTYIRLTGSMNMPIVYKEDYDYEIGKAVILKEGSDVCIIATGSMVHESLQAAKSLEEEGISCTVMNMHTIKPLDTQAIDTTENYKLIVTVEEHSVIGGLGSAVAEQLVKKKKHAPLLMIGIEDFFPHAGSYQNLIEKCGLTASQIKERISNALYNGNCPNEY